MQSAVTCESVEERVLLSNTLVSLGWSTKIVAYTLGVSNSTVRNDLGEAISTLFPDRPKGRRAIFDASMQCWAKERLKPGGSGNTALIRAIEALTHLPNIREQFIGAHELVCELMHVGERHVPHTHLALINDVLGSPPWKQAPFNWRIFLQDVAEKRAIISATSDNPRPVTRWITHQLNVRQKVLGEYPEGTKNMITEIIAALPDKMIRRVLALYYCSGNSKAQVAETLDITPRQVESVRAKGIRALRQHPEFLKLRHAHHPLAEAVELRKHILELEQRDNELRGSIWRLITQGQCIGLEAENRLDVKADELEASMRLANKLASLRIETIGQAVQVTEAQYLKNGMGRKSLNELKELLVEMGFNLGTMLPPPLARKHPLPEIFLG
jgi:hypothetical protein